MMSPILRICVLISGTGTNLKAILEACENGKIQAKIVCVGSDNPRAEGLQMASARKIPTFAVDYGKIIRTYKQNPQQLILPADFDYDQILSRQSLFRASDAPQKMKDFIITRALAEGRLFEHMTAYGFDLLVLAGFMRKLTPYLIDKINADAHMPGIMNIHPALLPAFAGMDGYGDTFRYGSKIGGCTVHFVDYGEDTGPIIGQKAFPILETDNLEDIRKKGLTLEWELYAECIRLYAEDRLRVESKSYEMPHGKIARRKIVRILAPK